MLHDLYFILVEKRSPNKKVGVVIRIVVSVLASLMYLSRVQEMPVKLGPVTSLAYCLILCWAFHFSFFNYTLNAFTGKNIFTLNDGPVDSFEKRMFPPQVWFIVRIIVLGLSIYMFYATPAYYGI